MNFAFTTTGGIVLGGTGNQVSSAWSFIASDGISLGGSALLAATYIYATPLGGFAILGCADNIKSTNWSWTMSFCHDHAANFAGYNYLTQSDTSEFSVGFFLNKNLK